MISPTYSTTAWRGNAHFDISISPLAAMVHSTARSACVRLSGLRGLMCGLRPFFESKTRSGIPGPQGMLLKVRASAVFAATAANAYANNKMLARNIFLYNHSLFYNLHRLLTR
jgi:hypothetical protein